MLEIKGLKKAFGSLEVLKGVDLKVKQGDVVAILGPSGSGKTTMLRCVNFLEHADGGSLIFDGKEYPFHNISKKDIAAIRQKTAFVFQNYNLFLNKTALHNVTEGLIIGRKMPKTRAEEKARAALEKVGMLDRADYYPHQLSGGQQQRVALARILAYEPEALLLDEPFSAMDTHLRERLRLELASVLSEYQGASIMVTHDRDEAYQLCDNLLLFSRGRVIAAGKTKDIFNDPGSVEAARLTGCKNISRIEKLDDHRVRALDWDNLELVTEKTVAEDITSVGIRAHDFEPVADQETGAEIENRIPVGNPKISEMPFEWYITLSNGLWWKIGKTIHTHSADGQIPNYVRVAPKAILLLRG